MRSTDRTARALPPRFGSVELIGSGANGSVFRAIDAAHGLPMAIKCLDAPSVADLPAFKQEFRSLVHVSDPHLVQLYELHETEDLVFFTMELVEGGTLVSPPALDQLRPVLGQVARALQSLHDTGLTHCDLKPSNVLMSHDGRAVVTDYGCVSHYTSPIAGFTAMGTPHYMAPEQWYESSTAPSVDWYALGVILFEALAGELPFDGEAGSILLAKRRASPAALRARLRRGDEALRALCVDLLGPDPAQRPDGRAVLAALGAPTTRSRAHGAGGPIGRHGALDALARWLETPRIGPAIAAVTGPGGIGKTSVLDAFVRSAASSRLVVRARCYPADRTPMRGIDELAGALMEALPSPAWSALGPGELSALRLFFPALTEQVGDGGAAIVMTAEASREALAGALAQLLATLANGRSVLVVVDDLQWADDAGLEVLRALAARGAPGLALLYACRTSQSLPLAPSAVIELGPLDQGDSARLVARLAPELVDAAGDITVASEGNPFLIEALTSHVRDGGVLAGGTETLHRILAAWGPGTFARQLLTVLAIADAPLRPDVAITATGGLEQDYLPTLARLRARRLVTSRRGRGEDLIEAYHRRWAEAVQDTIPEGERRRVHRDLAEAIALHTPHEIGRAADHSRAAGDLDLALARDLDAAHRAEALRLHDVAAMRLELAHASPLATSAMRASLHARLGDAHARAGRGAEAAKWYLLAAESADTLERSVAAERLAAEHLLFSGHHDAGKAVLRRVLERARIPFPESPQAAIAELGAWFGDPANHHLSAPDEETPCLATADDLARIDAAHAGTLGLTMSEPLASGVVQTHHVDLARAAGEPFRLLRAVTIHLVQTAGTRLDPQRTETLTRTARTLAARVATPEARAILAVAEAGAAWMEGRLDEALARCEDASVELARLGGLPWHSDTNRIVQLEVLCARGEMRAASTLLEESLVDARARDDRYLEAHLSVRIAPLIALWEGRPDLARRAADEGLARFVVDGFQLLHLMRDVHAARCDLYEGAEGAALARLEATWATMGRSGMQSIQHFAGALAQVAAVAAGAAGDAPGARWRALLPPKGATWAADLSAWPRDRAIAELAARGWVDPERALRVFTCRA